MVPHAIVTLLEYPSSPFASEATCGHENATSIVKVGGLGRGPTARTRGRHGRRREVQLHGLGLEVERLAGWRLHGPVLPVVVVLIGHLEALWVIKVSGGGWRPRVPGFANAHGGRSEPCAVGEQLIMHSRVDSVPAAATWRRPHAGRRRTARAALGGDAAAGGVCASPVGAAIAITRHVKDTRVTNTALDQIGPMHLVTRTIPSTWRP